MNGVPLIAPSLMYANPLCLAQELRAMEEAGVNFLHCDVMDGHFVDNFALYPDLLQAIREATTIPIDLHLLIDQPERCVERFLALHPATLTIHFEATRHHPSLLRTIRSAGCRAGLAFNASTPPTALEYLVDLVDVVVLLTIGAGFSGQPFEAGVLSKMRAVRQLIDERGRPIQLEADGAITPETAPAVLAAGADILVVGPSGFFGQARSYAEMVTLYRGMAANRFHGERWKDKEG